MTVRTLTIKTVVVYGDKDELEVKNPLTSAEAADLVTSKAHYEILEYVREGECVVATGVVEEGDTFVVRRHGTKDDNNVFERMVSAENEIKRLADFLMQNYRHEIRDGSAVDTVMRLLSKGIDAMKHTVAVPPKPQVSPGRLLRESKGG